jgi:hypothetical protein
LRLTFTVKRSPFGRSPFGRSPFTVRRFGVLTFGGRRSGMEEEEAWPKAADPGMGEESKRALQDSNLRPTD